VFRDLIASFAIVVEAMEPGEAVEEDPGEEEMGGSTETRALCSASYVLNLDTDGWYAQRGTKKCRRKRSLAELREIMQKRLATCRVRLGGQRERTRK